MKQVDKNHYEFDNYCGPDRWGSYYYQLKEVLDKSPSSILEVGGGDGVFENYLKVNTDVDYKSMNIAEDLEPDVLGSVEKIPLNDNSFDYVCAFEVLEHLPFEKFETSLKEMKRIAKRGVIVSLPHFGPMISFSFKIPFLKEKRFAFKVPYYRNHEFNGEHYWEIGKSGYEIAKIRNIIEKHFLIENDYVPHENSYHHFFVLNKRNHEV